jgi:hypothetical protein
MHLFEILIMMFLSAGMMFLIANRGQKGSANSKMTFDEWAFGFFLLLTLILFIAAVIVALFGL